LKDEARIDWSKPAREIDCLVRGLSPIPGAWCEAQGERLKVLYAEPVSGKGEPGEILDDALTVACGNGALKLVRLQRAGRAPMEAGELLRGFVLARGVKLS
jgi:methionyl-tRNA formyltransferase